MCVEWVGGGAKVGIAMVGGGAKRAINFPAVHAGRNYTGMFMYCHGGGGAKRAINFPAVHAGRNYKGMFMYCETERERLHKATPAVYSLKYICCKICLPLLYFFNKFYLGPL